MEELEKYRYQCIDKIQNYIDNFDEEIPSDIGKKIKCIGRQTLILTAKTINEIDQLMIKTINEIQ